MCSSQSAMALFVLLGTAGVARAVTIDVPLDAVAWFACPQHCQVSVPGNGSLANNAGDHLVATKAKASGGQNWSLGRDIVGTYNLQGGALRYQWKLNPESVTPCPIGQY
jgi:hypothetical protein